MEILFSQRHKKAIENGGLTITLSKRLRRKTYYLMSNNDQRYGWENEYSMLHDELLIRLKESYGEEKLKAYIDDDYVDTERTQDFLIGAKPESVLDAIELFLNLIEPKNEINFIRDMNTAFQIEDSPYRILDGYVIKLDSAFIESEALSKAYTLLATNHFEKACRDFLAARNNFTSGDYSGTITESNNAIESTIKKITGKETVKQGDLKKALLKSGIIPEYFQGFINHFEGLLQSAFTIANGSSRHGKKELPKKMNEVDRPVASFFLNLAGSLIVFMMERYQESLTKDDEIPF